MSFPETLHLFCRVVDNFGDIGVCWRLARQLANEHGVKVTLWLDDLPSLKRICVALDDARDEQRLAGVIVRRWPAEFGRIEPQQTADVVIEAFACELPTEYVAAMAKRATAPAWINLEYLSAEEWVEGSHCLPSPHPSLPLTKYFFFPGFTGRTGGLILEKSLLDRRDAFQADPVAARDFLAALGVNAQEDELVVSLFCYPTAPVREMFDAFAGDPARRVLCLVPEGVAGAEVGAFLQQSAIKGAMAERGSLKVRVIPFVDQDDYDRLLWSCALNFVRGEDSFVRAQWAARPFVWQIYRQEERAHEIKLKAFLARYEAVLGAEEAKAAADFWRAWNRMNDAGPEIGNGWERLSAVLPELARSGREWARILASNGDLAGRLLGFVSSLR